MPSLPPVSEVDRFWLMVQHWAIGLLFLLTATVPIQYIAESTWGNPLWSDLWVSILFGGLIVADYMLWVIWKTDPIHERQRFGDDKMRVMRVLASWLGFLASGWLLWISGVGWLYMLAEPQHYRVPMILVSMVDLSCVMLVIALPVHGFQQLAARRR